MKENDIDTIMQWYDRFTEIVRQLSMDADEQLQKLNGTVVTDEIALDYSEIGMLYAQKLLSHGWITQEQFSLAEDIEKMLEQMTQKRDLWNDDALSSSTEWDNCRKRGRILLETLEA